MRFGGAPGADRLAARYRPSSCRQATITSLAAECMPCAAVRLHWSVRTMRSAGVAVRPCTGCPRWRCRTYRSLRRSTTKRSGVGKAPMCAARRSILGAVTTWFGAPVTTPARTLVDLARLNRRDGIMAADAALREGLLTAFAIDAELERAAGWPGVRQAREVLALADPLAESPLESITRLALHDDEFPLPRLQRWIGRDRVDFYWPTYRFVLEADGRAKYTDDEFWEEKRREQRLRAHPAQVQFVERVIWSDITQNWSATSAGCAPTSAADPHLPRPCSHFLRRKLTAPAGKTKFSGAAGRSLRRCRRPRTRRWRPSSRPRACLMS